MIVARELDEVMALLSNCLDAFTAGLFVWDDHSRVLVLRSFHSLSKQIIPQARFSPEDGGLIGWVAKNNQAITVDHFDRDTRVLPYYRGEETIKSFLAVPLQRDQGVLCVDSKRQYVFTPKEQKLLHGFATVICNTLGAEQEKNRHQQLRQLLTLWYRADALPADAADPLPYFTRLLEQGCRYLEADAGLVALPVKGGGFLQPVAAAGDVPHSLLHRARPADQGIIGWIYQNRKSLVIPKFRDRARVVHLFDSSDGFGALGALVGMPLSWNAREVGGVIAFFHRSAAHWSKEEIGAITSVARRATLVLENFTLRRELALVSNLDPVTEVCNLEAFDRVLNKRLQRCQQNGTDLGLAVITIDGLDDLCTKVSLPELVPLRQRICSIFCRSLRGKQVIGCLEPDRFAILFDNEPPGQIHSHLKAMVRTIEHEILDQQGVPPGVRIRFGFAVFPQDAGSCRELWISAFRACSIQRRGPKNDRESASPAP